MGEAASGKGAVGSKQQERGEAQQVSDSDSSSDVALPATKRCLAAESPAASSTPAKRAKGAAGSGEERVEIIVERLAQATKRALGATPEAKGAKEAGEFKWHPSNQAFMDAFRDDGGGFTSQKASQWLRNHTTSKCAVKTAKKICDACLPILRLWEEANKPLVALEGTMFMLGVKANRTKATKARYIARFFDYSSTVSENRVVALGLETEHDDARDEADKANTATPRALAHDDELLRGEEDDDGEILREEEEDGDTEERTAAASAALEVPKVAHSLLHSSARTCPGDAFSVRQVTDKFREASHALAAGGYEALKKALTTRTLSLGECSSIKALLVTLAPLKSDVDAAWTLLEAATREDLKRAQDEIRRAEGSLL